MPNHFDSCFIYRRILHSNVLSLFKFVKKVKITFITKNETQISPQYLMTRLRIVMHLKTSIYACKYALKMPKYAPKTSKYALKLNYLQKSSQKHTQNIQKKIELG